MRLLVLQHIACEHPGRLCDFLAADGVDWVAVELDEGESIPPLEDFDAMWVMGGPVWVGVAGLTGVDRPLDTLCVEKPRTRPVSRQQQPGDGSGSPFFLSHIFQHCFIKLCLSKKLFQLLILSLKLFQTLSIISFHATVLIKPAMPG